MANANSYYLYQKYEKYGDQPWTPVYPTTLSIDGDGTKPLVVKQLNDSSCVPTYRTTSGTPYCVNFDKYVDVTTEETFDDGVTWYFVSLTPTLVEVDSDDCGVLYRWVESGTTCIGFDKRQNNIKEKSIDGGTTWTVVTPTEYSASTLIEHNSPDCGYEVCDCDSFAFEGVEETGSTASTITITMALHNSGSTSLSVGAMEIFTTMGSVQVPVSDTVAASSTKNITVQYTQEGNTITRVEGTISNISYCFSYTCPNNYCDLIEGDTLTVELASATSCS